MSNVVKYLIALSSYRAHIGFMEFAILVWSVFFVKISRKPNLRMQRTLERWCFFRSLLKEERINVISFSLQECRLRYTDPEIKFAVSITLRIPCSNSSDSLVFGQVFQQAEYQKVLDWFLTECPHAQMAHVFDIGANIGCATLFIYARYPNAKIICLEPEESNYERLVQNLEMNPAGHFQHCNAAIWTSAGKLYGVHDLRDGKEWSSHFVAEPVAKDSRHNAVEAIDVWKLLQLSGFDQVDFLKMDVEGAEKVLLNDAGFRRFLQAKVSRIAAEIHPEFISEKEAADILKSVGFEIKPLGEFLCGYNRNVMTRH